MSGLDPANYATSKAAAVSVQEDRAAQRQAVYEVIKAAGAYGRTDDEVQAVLDLGGNSERPRRLELWKADKIRILHGADDQPVRRMTRNGRRAIVWVAVVGKVS